jgi:hypothetical protein
MTDFEEAIEELGRCSWTAVNVIGKNSDFVTQDIVSHMEKWPILENYRSLQKAATKVKMEWLKIKKQLNDKSLELALKVVSRD